MTVSEAGSAIEAASVEAVGGQQRAWYHFRSGLGSTAGGRGVLSPARHATKAPSGRAAEAKPTPKLSGTRLMGQLLFRSPVLFSSVSANAGKLLFRCLSRRSSRRPLLRHGPAIPLRREAVLELDVVGRKPQRSYRRRTSSMQRQAQVTGVRGVCVR